MLEPYTSWVEQGSSTAMNALSAFSLFTWERSPPGLLLAAMPEQEVWHTTLHVASLLH